jgi:hypothetical protein
MFTVVPLWPAVDIKQEYVNNLERIIIKQQYGNYKLVLILLEM